MGSMTDDAAPQDESRALAMAGELRALIGQLKRRLREQGSLGDFTPSQINALVRLEQAPATTTALAQAQGIRPQSMSAVIAGLEAAGLVAGASDPGDGRKTIWSITQAARDQVTALRAARADWLARAIRRELDAAEQDQLAAGIALLKRLALS